MTHRGKSAVDIADLWETAMFVKEGDPSRRLRYGIWRVLDARRVGSGSRCLRWSVKQFIIVESVMFHYWNPVVLGGYLRCEWHPHQDNSLIIGIQ